MGKATKTGLAIFGVGFWLARLASSAVASTSLTDSPSRRTTRGLGTAAATAPRTSSAKTLALAKKRSASKRMMSRPGKVSASGWVETSWKETSSDSSSCVRPRTAHRGRAERGREGQDESQVEHHATSADQALPTPAR